MYRIITLIIVFGYISSESISSQTWSNLIQDLSLKIHNEKNIESHPLNEGFIMIPDDHPKPSKKVIVKPDNRIFTSNNISSTTCRTVVIVKINKQTSSPPTPILSHSMGHLGRRLLNEPSYDTDIDTTSKSMPIDQEFDSFLKVDDEELSKQLLLMDASVQGSGETTEDTTQQTSMSTTTTTTTTTITPLMEEPNLSNHTKFILMMNCTNANNTVEEILAALNNRSGPYSRPNQSELQCNNDTGKGNVTLEFNTDNSTGILNRLFEDLDYIARDKNVEVLSDNVCGNNETVRVTNVTSCYLINLCHLCGTNPLRGVCVPEYKESKCECLPNKNDSSRPYAGERCLETARESPSIPARWTPVIVGILAGLTGVFGVITIFLWTMAVWRGGSPHKNDLPIRRLWHLPRAQVPTAGTSENVQDYSNNTISTLSSHQTDSDYNRSDITDSTFFKELDQKMGENLRATITRPNTSAMLASLPLDTISSLNNYDPIDELDAIIDNEDINTVFHDPLNELFEDNEPLEIINPNLRLPRPNIDS